MYIRTHFSLGDLNIYGHKNKEDKNKELPKCDAPLKLYDEHVLLWVLSLSLCINPVGNNVKSRALFGPLCDWKAPREGSLTVTLGGSKV